MVSKVESSEGTERSMEAPNQWPPEVTAMYDPIRNLGKGGFASVVLARSKNSSGELVAMKVVGSRNASAQEYGYAHREIDILGELQHPNIMKLIDFWETEDHATCAAVMALTYSSGPTLQSLLETGGALNLVFAQVVAAQIVDAVAYLHSRAVIHRDIKPDNFIVSGATKGQDEIWDDIVKPPNNDEGWKELLKKWHVTLVDFGFARALTIADMQKPAPKARRTDLDNSVRSTESSSSRGSQLSRSYSRRIVRKMSALGNRNYAAPEVRKNIEIQDMSHHFDGNADITKNLSDHVSFYGLLADAYSVGNTIKFMVTGAPPHENVEDLLALENSPIGMILRCCQSKKGDDVRRVRYRRVSGVPSEVVRLIRGATSADPNKRTSVRALRLYPWIDEPLVDRTSSGLREVHFLDLVKQKDRAEEHTEGVAG